MFLSDFHHCGSLIKSFKSEISWEERNKVNPLDKDHFLWFKWVSTQMIIRYTSFVFFYIFSFNFNEFILLENDSNLVSYLKHVFLDLFIRHVINRPILVKKWVLFEFQLSFG